MPVRENSSIPLCLGVCLGPGKNTNAECPHPPSLSGIRCRYHKDVVIFLPTPGGCDSLPYQFQRVCKCNHHHQYFQWLVIVADIDMSFSPRISSRGKKHGRGRFASTGCLLLLIACTVQQWPLQHITLHHTHSSASCWNVESPDLVAAANWSSIAGCLD